MILRWGLLSKGAEPNMFHVGSFWLFIVLDSLSLNSYKKINTLCYLRRILTEK